MRKLFYGLAAVYIGLVVLANWLASKYTITVPFTSYVAPAGIDGTNFSMFRRTALPWALDWAAAPQQMGLVL